MDVYDTDQETAFLKDQYPLTDKLSVDYAGDGTIRQCGGNAC